VFAQDETAADTHAEQRAAALHTTCDTVGRFTFDELPAGEHPVMAIADRFAAGAGRVRTDAAACASIELRLQRGATIEGRVLQRDGTPFSAVSVLGANISARTTPFREFRHRLTGVAQSRTEAEGWYRLQYLLPGTVSMAFDAVVSGSQVRVDRRFTLEDGEQRRCDVTLPEGQGIAGRVVDGRGQPLSGWWVRASGGNTHRSALCDAGGRFRLEGLPDRAYRVGVFDLAAPGLAREVCHAMVDDVRPGASDVLLCVPSQPGTGAWITGRVVRPAGELGRVFLVLSPLPAPFGGSSEELAADAGTFRIGPLPPGGYELQCAAAGRMPQSQRGLQLAAGQTLELPAFRLDEQRPLLLRLHFDDGRPVAGAVVTLLGEGEPLACTETSAGEYRSPPVDPGRHLVQVRGIDVAALRTEVEVGHDAETVVERRLRAGCTVALRFTPAGGRWGAGLQVWLQDAQGKELVRDTLLVEHDERFDWQLGLAAGRYTVNAEAQGTGGSATHAFEVPEGSGVHAIDVRLQAR
jgi:hypothetical protein